MYLFIFDCFLPWPESIQLEKYPPNLGSILIKKRPINKETNSMHASQNLHFEVWGGDAEVHGRERKSFFPIQQMSTMVEKPTRFCLQPGWFGDLVKYTTKSMKNQTKSIISASRMQPIIYQGRNVQADQFNRLYSHPASEAKG